MSHQFLMFLAPDKAVMQGLPQAETLEPVAGPPKANPLDTTVSGAATPVRIHRTKFLFCIAGNALGLAGFIAGCWYCLQLLQAFL